MTRELLTGADLKGPLQLNGAAGTSGQVLTSAGAGAIPTWSPAGGFNGGTLTNNLTLAAGTSSLSPLTLQSGANLSTAAAGAVEFDGKVVYTTPASRGVSPSMMFYRLNANRVGFNVTAAQSVFGVGITLESSTIYTFQANYLFQKTAGSASHTMGLCFGGTATLNNIEYHAYFTNIASVNSSDFASASGLFIQTAATFDTATATSTTLRTRMFTLQGTVSVDAGGTFIPQYQLSAPPGAAYTTRAGSYFAVWPIGAAGADTSVGPWA